MIITRCLSPPHENPTETIYSGKFLEPEEMPKAVTIAPTSPTQYFYTISELEIIREDKDNNPILNIRETSVLYNDILAGYDCIDSITRRVSTSQIPLDDSTKKGLIDLIKNKD